MQRSEALKGYSSVIETHVLVQYRDADSSFCVNDNDPDLTKITISLPAPPKWHLIEGFGKPARAQKFVREKIPSRLNELQRDVTNRLKDSRKTGKNEVLTAQRIIEEIWEVLNRRQREYVNEITWIKKQIYHCHYGYWLFINGKPTFLDGWHYRFLNFWDMTDAEVDYRDRDRRWFLFARYIYTSQEDQHGYDNGHRTFFGFIYPKHRRDGATHKSLCVGYDIMTKTLGNVIGGIQSFDDDNAGEHYKNKLLPAFKSMPFFFKPVWKGSQAPQSELHFTRVDNSIGEELGSKMNYATTAARKFYDGKKLYYYQGEEEGKCLSLRTLVKMYDGSNKEAKDIVVGDVLCGDDMLPRTVLSVKFGSGEMYRITPRKGSEWGCNGRHTLVLKACAGKGYTNGEEVEISVNDYIKWAPSKKKNFSLYRVGVDFPRVEHILDPYFLGIWLGDGHAADAAISKPDIEIRNYVEEFAKSRGLSTRFDNMSTFIYGTQSRKVIARSDKGEVLEFESILDASIKMGTTIQKIRWSDLKRTSSSGFTYSILDKVHNSVFHDLLSLNLINNKHIPEEYLIDSRENRLSLLAGILDTDGYMSPGDRKMCYEVTQKSKSIADGIVRLCQGLGFSISTVNKTAKMKRPDGSIYECLVYRMSIYGNNLFEIPCIIPRKKAYKIEDKQGRDPMRTGFEIIPDGIGEYVGFQIDGNHRFLLGDYTVTHNCLLENVLERWDVVKQTLGQGAGSIINGFAIHPTTVADIKVGGGKNFFDLCESSKFYDRNPETYQTKTGLARLFIPGYDGLEGFIGPYGESIMDIPTDDQANFIGRPIGAKAFIQSQLDEWLKKGDPESMRSYREFKRLYPTSYADCFRDQAGDAGLDIEKLDAAIERLRRAAIDENKPPTTTGNLLYIVDGESNPLSAKEFLALGYDRSSKSYRVEWFPTKSGRWKVSKILGNQESNLRYRSDGIWYPTYPFKYTLGADPFQFLKTGDAEKRGDKSRLSKGGIAVFYERDFQKDPEGKDTSEWDSYRFCVTYDNRADEDDEYAEEVLMTAIYWGAEVYPEQNIKLIWKHIVKRGFGGYMKYQIDEATGKRKDHPGFYSLTDSKQDLFNAIKRYIFHHSTRERHIDFLLQCRQIRGLDYMTDFDLFVACGGALLGSQIVRYESEITANQEVADLSKSMPMFIY